MTTESELRRELQKSGYELYKVTHFKKHDRVTFGNRNVRISLNLRSQISCLALETLIKACVGSNLVKENQVMIFSISNHIELIQKGKKTQTRRHSDRYEIGKTYAIQPTRTSKAITDGRILILQKRREICCEFLSEQDAEAEGGYDPEEFERIYNRVHPNWLVRFAYTFQFIPKEEVENHG